MRSQLQSSVAHTAPVAEAAAAAGAEEEGGMGAKQGEGEVSDGRAGEYQGRAKMPDDGGEGVTDDSFVRIQDSRHHPGLNGRT